MKRAIVLLISWLMIPTAQGGNTALNRELLALQVDLDEGLVSEVNDVRQPLLHEIFLQMAADELRMEKLRAEHIGQTDLEVLTVALAEASLK